MTFFFLRLSSSVPSLLLSSTGKGQRSGSRETSPDDASPRLGREWRGVAGSLWSCVYPRMSQANALFSAKLSGSISHNQNRVTIVERLFSAPPPSRGSALSEGGRFVPACCHKVGMRFKLSLPEVAQKISEVVMPQLFCSTTTGVRNRYRTIHALISASQQTRRFLYFQTAFFLVMKPLNGTWGLS